MADNYVIFACLKEILSNCVLYLLYLGNFNTKYIFLEIPKFSKKNSFLEEVLLKKKMESSKLTNDSADMC